MDFYLTNITSGDRLRFPIAPDRINIKTGALTVQANIIKTGEIKIPRGSALTGYSWNGSLPGERMANYSFVFDWQQPARIVSLLRTWEENGDILRFMITDLNVNADVFIESFSYEYFGLGDCSYTINLTVKRELKITTITPPPVPEVPPTEQPPEESKVWGTVKTSGNNLNVRQKPSTDSKVLGSFINGTKVEILGSTGNWYIIPYEKGSNGKAYIYKSYVKLNNSGGSSGGNSSGDNGSSGNNGKTNNSSGTIGGNYTVKSGDSLLQIAKSQLGDSSRWLEIYELNKDAIDANNKGTTNPKHTLKIGMKLKLPAKKISTTTSSTSSAFDKKIVTAVTNTVTTVKNAVQGVVPGIASSLKSTVSKLTTTKPSGTVTTVKAVATKVPTAVSSSKKSNIKENYIK